MNKEQPAKPNKETLRKIMQDYRLGSKHVAELIHTTDSTIRTYCSNYGADISTANLELLQFKLGEKQAEAIKNVSISK
tara:strand:- start:3781 stop:4014 length:234 start_codon:yes stop_codon:yes gene_type:complete